MLDSRYSDTLSPVFRKVSRRTDADYRPITVWVDGEEYLEHDGDYFHHLYVLEDGAIVLARHDDRNADDEFSFQVLRGWESYTAYQSDAAYLEQEVSCVP
jgi:hypothetical protein